MIINRRLISCGKKINFGDHVVYYNTKWYITRSQGDVILCNEMEIVYRNTPNINKFLCDVS